MLCSGSLLTAGVLLYGTATAFGGLTNLAATGYMRFLATTQATHKSYADHQAMFMSGTWKQYSFV